MRELKYINSNVEKFASTIMIRTPKVSDYFQYKTFLFYDLQTCPSVDEIIWKLGVERCRMCTTGGALTKKKRRTHIYIYIPAHPV